MPDPIRETHERDQRQAQAEAWTEQARHLAGVTGTYYAELIDKGVKPKHAATLTINFQCDLHGSVLDIPGDPALWFASEEDDEA